MTVTKEQLLVGLKAIKAIIDNNAPLEADEVDGIWLIAAELVQAHGDECKSAVSPVSSQRWGPI